MTLGLVDCSKSDHLHKTVTSVSGTTHDLLLTLIALNLLSQSTTWSTPTLNATSAPFHSTYVVSQGLPFWLWARPVYFHFWFFRRDIALRFCCDSFGPFYFGTNRQLSLFASFNSNCSLTDLIRKYPRDIRSTTVPPSALEVTNDPRFLKRRIFPYSLHESFSKIQKDLAEKLQL